MGNSRPYNFTANILMIIKKFLNFGVILILLLSIFFIFNLFKSETSSKIENLETSTETYNSNIIKNVNYTSTDNKGNKYTINAKIGEIDINDSSIIFLNVKANIELQNSEIIKIFSDFGKYNINNYDTVFSKNVKITYLKNKILSEYLDFSIGRNSMIISKNVRYYNDKNILISDVIEMNLETKDTKVFMHNVNEKVNIKSINWYGSYKKFRIKSFKNIEPIVEFQNVSLSYGNRLILDNINFKINKGQIFGMLVQWCRKIYNIQFNSGLISPQHGKIIINGEDVTKYPIYLRTKI